jgi:hypothetical protein
MGIEPGLPASQAGHLPIELSRQFAGLLFGTLTVSRYGTYGFVKLFKNKARYRNLLEPCLSLDYLSGSHFKIDRDAQI